MMKAALTREWNELVYRDVETPTIGDEECLIKVRYCGVCGSDVHVFRGHHPTAVHPVIQGHEFFGVIDDINSESRGDLKKGDRVVAEPLLYKAVLDEVCANQWHVSRDLGLLGIHRHGGFAEYVKCEASKVIRIDDDVPDRIAALTEPFAVGVHVNMRGGTKNGDRVLVIGGGPIGTIVGIVARICGASLVAVSELSDLRLENVSRFGFVPIDAKDRKALTRAYSLTDDLGFDVVFECSGAASGMQFGLEACRIRGNYVPVGFPSERPTFDILKLIFKELHVIGSRVYSFDHFKRTTEMLTRIVHEGVFDLDALISDEYPLEKLGEAIEEIESGLKAGKILIKP